MSASVKIMLSYDYCHFEIALGSDADLTNREVNEMRKDVQRLCDEAVRQYKKAKVMAANQIHGKYEKEEFLGKIKEIQRTPEGERTINQIAMLKQYQDEEWQKQFDYDYDYEDDEFPF